LEQIPGVGRYTQCLAPKHPYPLCERSAKFETSQKCSLFYVVCGPNLLSPSSMAPMECHETAECIFPFAGWRDGNRREQHSHCHHQHNQWQHCSLGEPPPRCLNRYVTVHRPIEVIDCPTEMVHPLQGGGIYAYGGTGSTVVVNLITCTISGNSAASSVSRFPDS
jgi:hypothetical protein